MGARGPKGKTLEQHLRDGTFRHDRHGHLLDRPGARELLERHGIQPPVPEFRNSETSQEPDGLKGEELAVWRALRDVLGARAAGMELTILREFAVWEAELRRVQGELKKLKPSSIEYGRAVRSAAVLSEQVKGYATLFRMTPEDDRKVRGLGAYLNGAAKNGPVGPAAPNGVPKVRTRPQTQLDREGRPG